MIRKLLVVLIGWLIAASTAWAVVDVNTADQATLETLKGIGPVKSKAIIDERSKNGPFKDAADLAARVKGLGTKSVTSLQSEGLVVGGSASAAAGAAASASDANAMKSKKSGKKAKDVAGASASTSASASTAAGASETGGKPSKSKKKNSKAAAASQPAAQ
jgi:competence protein ComEA